jgi:hypothetical protein
VDNADAISAALSDKQAGEVKIKPLEWPNDSDWNIATSELGRYVVRPCLATNFSGQWLLMRAGAEDSDKTLYPSEDAAKAAAQADYEQRIRSALVDVPAVEPAGEAGEMPGSNGGFTMAVFKASDVPLGTKLYAHPPHREGEDSAEVERLRDLLSRAEEYVIDGVTNAKAEAEMNAPYPARAPRYDAALAEVRQLYADIQAALAATRSGSTTTASGKDF